MIKNIIEKVEMEIKDGKPIDVAIRRIAERFDLAIDGEMVRFLREHFLMMR